MAYSPFDLIRQGAQRLVDKGRSAFTSFDTSIKKDVPNIIRTSRTAPKTVAKEIVQGTTRGVATIGQTVISPLESIIDKGRLGLSSTVTPKTKFEEKIYGRNTPFSITSEGQEFTRAVGVPEGSKREKVIAPVLGTLFPLLDAIPGGRPARTAIEKFLPEALQNFVKITDSAPIRKSLIDAGVDSRIVDRAANDIAKATDVKQVERALRGLPITEATPNALRSEVSTDLSQQQRGPTIPEAPRTPQSAITEQDSLARSSQLKASYDESIQKPIDNANDAKKYFNEDEQIYKEITDLESFPTQRQEITSIAKETGLNTKAQSYKDIGNAGKGFRDVFRNFERVFDADTYKVMKERVLDPFDASKGKFIDLQKTYADDLQKTIVKKLGIGRGTKESSWLMKYGERRSTYDDVVKAIGKQKADNIVEADKWFRKTYDDLISEVNNTRKQIYPNKPEKLVPKRQDYYRHFTEMTNDLRGLKNIFETPSGIDPKLAGLSPYTKPQSKWASFAQKRTGSKTIDDAVGGFLDYLPSAAYAIHVDPNIGKFRGLAESLRGSSKGNLNNFIDFLDKFANDLSGKTNAIDRIVTDFVPGGRTTLNALDWVNRRVKANTILGNLSSSIAQIFNVPQGIASAKLYSFKGLKNTLLGILKPNLPMAKSTFLKERYFKGYSQFDTSMLDNTRKFASWITGVLDEAGTKFIWNSHYEKALAEKIANPIKHADDVTRKMVAGRGIGEVPLAQKSRIFQMVAPFQLEVANLWHVMGEMVSKKQFGQLATIFIVNHIMNKAAEEVRGSGVTIDPIQAVIDAYQAYNESDSIPEGILRAGGRVAGEVLSNVPLGQTFASVYPEKGFKVGDNRFPTREELFGEGDPTRFGPGLVATKGLQDPLYKLLPAYGGSQIKKTIEGIMSLVEGGSFDKGDNLQFIAPDSTLEKVQTVLFGKYSSDNAKNYFDKEELKAKEQSKVQPVYDTVQQLKSEGKTIEAKNIVDNLSKKEWEIYKQIHTATKSDTTLKNKREITPIYLEVQKLKSEGKTDEAKAIVDSLSDEQWKAYSLVKDQVDKDKKAAEGIKPEYQEGEPQTPKSLINTTLTYAKAIGVSPVTAFNRIFTGQKIRYVTNGTVVVERLPLSESQAIKKLSGQDVGETKLDHIIPLQLGGSNSESNLQLVPNEIWKSYTPVENTIGKALRDGKIEKKEAQELIKQFKNGEITAQKITEMLQ